MFNSFSLELFKFKIRLRELGVTEDSVDSYTHQLQKELESLVEESLSDGMSEAVSKGIEKSADDFVADLRPDPERFEIKTLSGRTDYTVPPYSMRPGLLKNAKHSKDGTAYKVVPVGKKKVDTSAAKMMSLENVHKYAAADQKQKLQQKLSAKGLGGNDHTNFRTITSKQDPSSWVHPGFERDFTGDLEDINARLKSRIEGMLQEAMERIEQQALNNQKPGSGDY